MIQDPDVIAKWYREQLRIFGYDHRTLGFNHRSSQLKRFEALERLGSFDGRSVLDVGCGFADFYGHLRERGQRPLYTGVDICPEFVDECRRRFGGDAACRFELGDVMTFQPSAPFDYVVASGVFGITGGAEPIPVGEGLTRLFSWCSVGLAVNFLSLRAAAAGSRGQYVDAGGVVRAALKLTPAVRLAHDYLPNDFTVFLYRKPAWEAEAPLGAAS